MMSRLLKASYLWTALDEAGVVAFNYAARWIRRQEKKGKFVYPREPDSQRKFTNEQIEDIVKAFSPGGSGYWKLEV